MRVKLLWREGVNDDPALFWTGAYGLRTDLEGSVTGSGTDG